MSYPFLNRRQGSGDEIARGQAGENLGDRKVVYRDANGLWRLADADTAATMPTLGFTIGSIASGNWGRILLQGMVGLAGWAWIPGGELYASAVAGEITQVVPAAPDIVQVIAIAHDTNVIYFDPKSALIGVALGCRVLEGSTAYVGFDACKEPYTNYWLCDGVADDVQINLAVAYVVAEGGGSIELESETYVLADPIDLETEVMLTGQGRNTFLNGDGLLTGEHAITITSEDDCVIRDLSIQTENGGGKTCHCIFIDNASNRTLIENVTFVDSDDNCVHIEGISQGDTRILNCDFLGADGHGIYTNMDPANAVYFLEVRDCRFTATGGDGIHLEDGIDCQIFDNVFDTSLGSDGVELVNSDDCHISNNNMSGAAGYDINISAANCDRTRVFNNILHGTGTGCINDLGTDTKMPFVYSQVSDPTGNVGDHPALLLPDAVDTTFRFQTYVPLDFQELVTAQVIAVQTVTAAGPPDIQWSTTTDWGKLCAGENYNAGSDAETDQTTAMAQNNIVCIDVSASLTAIAAGDLVGFTFIRRGTQGGDTVNATVYYLGFRLRYV